MRSAPSTPSVIADEIQVALARFLKIIVAQACGDLQWSAEQVPMVGEVRIDAPKNSRQIDDAAGIGRRAFGRRGNRLILRGRAMRRIEHRRQIVVLRRARAHSRSDLLLVKDLRVS
jgi:hypothetical protein